MAGHNCHNCIYSVCDPEWWLRCAWAGKPLVPQCANHPWWPGRMHDVPGVPCRNYRPKPVLPQGDNVRLIPLGDGFYAYVDKADYEWLSRWKWHVVCGGYAARHEKGKYVFMHREIMTPPKGKIVDHADGNKANNCRFNLRVCTRTENLRNLGKHHHACSRFKGVSYDKRLKKWYARCAPRKERHFRSSFDDEVEAARAYDRAAVERFGEFARLNFPEEWPPQRRAQVHAEWQKAENRKGAKKRAKSKSGKAKGKKTPARAATRERRVRRQPTKVRRSEGERVRRQEGQRAKIRRQK